MQEAAETQAASLHEDLLRCEADAAAQLAAESARRAQAEEAVEQYIAAHYASQAAAQVCSRHTCVHGLVALLKHVTRFFTCAHVVF